MKPLQLLIPIICAARMSAKIAKVNTSETRHSARSLALPPPSPIDGLRPFQFPTDYNGTANDFNGIPERWLYCSKTSEVVMPGYVDELVNGSFLKSTVDNGTIPNNTGWVWPYLLDQPSTQIYICNHNRLFSFPISAGLINMARTWLNEICGETMAGYVYIDTPWDVAIGRNSTDPQGNPKPECGGQWSPDSIWA